ncbi:MAG: PD40 domain-containing protein [Myxococcaceae bacterium]|nr:PD40 domain-containing protein [Myxococcaceae bacterium]
MRRRHVVLLVVTLGACSAPPGASDGSVFDAGPRPRTDAGPAPTYRVPRLELLQPSSTSAGAAALTLTLTGAFDADAVVTWSGVDLPTRFVSGARLEADVEAGRLQFPGAVPIAVELRGEDGTSSAALLFSIVVGPAVPQLDALAPGRAFAGDPPFTGTVTGWNFEAGSTVRWNGAARVTTFVSSGELRWAALGSDVAAAGTAAVTVATPGASAASNALSFTVDAVATPAAGGLERVSLAEDGGQSSGGVRDARLSADGRYVAFSSTGADVVAGDSNGREDVFLRDTCRGVTGCVPVTLRVSLGEDGGEGDADARYPALSASGRWVAFVSSSTNLTALDTTPVQRVYLRDTCLGAPSGCTPALHRVSVRSDDGTPNGAAESPSVSADGRFVAFVSASPDLVPNDTATRDVYLRDTCVGAAAACTPTTLRVSESLDGEGVNQPSAGGVVGPNGRFVVFITTATNLDAGIATPGHGHAYLRDLCHGAVGCTRSLTQLDVALDGGEADRFAGPGALGVSADGRWAMFSTSSTNLTAHAPSNFSQLFLRDTCAGAPACTPSTTLVSVSVGGDAGASFTTLGAVSADGRWAVFSSAASDLVPGDTNGREDLFVRDLCTGQPSACAPRTRRVSLTVDGGQPNGHVSSERAPGVSSDGANVCWATGADNVVPDDTNNRGDAFVSGTGF